VVFDDRPNRELVQIHSETGAVSTTEASSYQRSSAPSFEVCGRLVLTPGGSGGGGGDAGKDPSFDPTTFAVLAGPMVPAFQSLVGTWKEAGPVEGLKAMGQSLL